MKLMKKKESIHSEIKRTYNEYYSGTQTAPEIARKMASMKVPTAEGKWGIEREIQLASIDSDTLEEILKKIK